MNDLTGWNDQQLLAAAVAQRVAWGWRVESTPTPGQVVMVHGRRPNHILHLLLTVVTLGLWLPIWILVAVTSKEQRAVLSEEQLRWELANPQPPRVKPWWRRDSTIVVACVVAAVLFAVIVQP